MIPLWLALASCNPPAAQPGEALPDDEAVAPIPGGPTDSGLPGLPEIDGGPTQASWTATDIDAALQEALGQGIPDPWTLQAQLLEVFSHGDGACPGHPNYIDDRNLLGCTAASGWMYSGVSEWTELHGEVEGMPIEGELTFGDIIFASPEGLVFEVGGFVQWMRLRDARFDVARIETQHQGSWHWDGDPIWLDQTVSGRYQIRMERVDGNRQITLTGAARVRGIDLDFQDLLLEEGDCAWAPRGALAVRDPAGGWHRLDFGEACQPCASPSYQGGEPQGEVCVDLAAIPAGLMAELDRL